MNPIGANPAQLDELANLFDRLSADLEFRRGALTVLIEADRFWRGRTASEFRHLWSSTYAPQINAVAGFLHAEAVSLRQNAVQQLQASGEYGSTVGASFMTALFGTTHQVESSQRSVLHGLKDVLHRAESDVESGAALGAADAAAVWHQTVHDVKAVGGSPEFAKFLKDTQLVGQIASVVAILPIPVPGLQAAALAVALTANAIVLAGHLAQMANTGKFDGGEFAADSLNLAGSALGAGAAVKGLDTMDMITGSTKISDLGDVPAVAKSLAGAVTADGPLGGAIVVQRVASTGINTWQTTDAVAGDLRQGYYGAAVGDSFGYASDLGQLGGDGTQAITGAISAMGAEPSAVLQ